MANVDKSTDRSRILPLNWGERAFGYMDCRKLLYSDFAASGDTVDLIDLPANSVLVSLMVVTKTAFNGTSPVLIFGDSTDPDGYLASGEVEEAAVMASPMDAADVAAAYAVKAARPVYTSAAHIRATFTYSGTPTAGEAWVIAQILELPSVS